MTETLLRFLVQRDGNVIKVRRYRSETEKVYFKLPDHLQSKDQHPELFTYKAIIRAEAALTEDLFYRHITVKMSGAHAARYLDETRNPIFSDISLEEDENQTEKNITVRTPILNASGGAPSDRQPEQNDSVLQERISKLESLLKAARIQNVADVERKFALNRYECAEDAVSWFEKFDAECERYGITERMKKVEALGKMMKPDSSAQDWYENSLKKLAYSTQWATWRASFTTVFAAKNWQPVRDALNFRYSSGPLIDYGLKKEKKLLLADLGCSQKSLINIIVMGLPEPIQDQLERKEFVLVNDLLAKMGAMTDPTKTSRWTKEKQSNFEVKSPCAYCAAKGFRRRFHRIEVCRVKQKDEELEKKSSKTKTSKNSANLTEKRDNGLSSESSEDEKFDGQRSSLNYLARPHRD